MIITRASGDRLPGCRLPPHNCQMSSGSRLTPGRMERVAIPASALRPGSPAVGPFSGEMPGACFITTAPDSTAAPGSRSPGATAPLRTAIPGSPFTRHGRDVPAGWRRGAWTTRSRRCPSRERSAGTRSPGTPLSGIGHHLRQIPPSRLLVGPWIRNTIAGARVGRRGRFPCCAGYCFRVDRDLPFGEVSRNPYGVLPGFPGEGVPGA